MTKEEYIALYERYLSGDYSSEDEKLLMEYHDEFVLSDLPWNHALMGSKQEVRDEVYQKLEERINHRKKLSLLRWSAAAAIALCILAAGLYKLWNPPVQQLAEKENQQQRLKNDILPGGNKAVLTLADGSQIVLDDVNAGFLASEGNTRISKTKDGQLVYHADAGNPAKETQINTISTPRGGQYEVILPDGTKVWLNASSSISFPAVFAAKERKVVLKGEAYFEAAKAVSDDGKRIPFKVVVNDMEVEVLGTHFNIMAYSDEEAVKTTLLEGAVRLTRNTSQVLLKPGRQAVVYAGSDNIKVQNVDVEEAVAWKNGYFTFNNENIHSVMRKIARWYDVEVEYQGNMAEKDFGGSVSKFENISEVLKMLELTGTVHFNIKERRVLVMP